MYSNVGSNQGFFDTGRAASIPISTTTSSIINCGNMSLCGVYVPAAFTGTAISFLASADGTNFFPVYSTTTGTALSYTVAQGHFCAIDPKDFYGVQYLKIVSNATETALRALAAALKGF